MRTRAVMAAGAAVLASATLGGAAADAQQPCGGTGQPPCATPTPTPTASPAPATVTLEPSTDAVRFDGRRTGRVTFTGAVKAAGAGAAGARLLLTGRSPAYDRTVVRRLVTADARGRFRVRLRPSANAVFRARLTAGQAIAGASPQRRVSVSPRLVLTSGGATTALRLRLSAQAPGSVSSAGSARKRAVRAGGARRAVFYLRLRGESRYRRVDAARLSAARCAQRCERTASVVVRRPSLLRRVRAVGACTPGLAFRGFGEVTACGAARRRF